MTTHVYSRAEPKRRATITPELRARVCEALASASQQQVARQLDLSQAAVSKIARAAAAEAANGGRC